MRRSMRFLSTILRKTQQHKQGDVAFAVEPHDEHHFAWSGMSAGLYMATSLELGMQLSPESELHGLALYSPYLSLLIA